MCIKQQVQEQELGAFYTTQAKDVFSDAKVELEILSYDANSNQIF